MKRFFIRTYGCPMNVADSERIASGLRAKGWEKADSMKEADLIIISTCSVRQTSEDKIYGLAPKINQLRMANSDLRVLLTGCMLGSAREPRRRIKLYDLQQRMPWVDEFVTVEELRKRYPLDISRLEVGEEALVPVMRGCDQFCTYCAVPFGRGPERSRTPEEIVAEVKDFVDKGAKKVVLLGQNINSYGKNLDLDLPPSTHPFAYLLRKVHKIQGLEKISFLVANPWDWNEDLIEALTLPKVEKYVHLPVQSGDDQILRRMNRPYTAAQYKELVEKIREKVPHVKIGTDLLVGFPGETKEQFENTVKLAKELRFDKAYIAMYSQRPGTVGAKIYQDDVPREEKRRRHRVLTQVIKSLKNEEN